MGFKFYAVELSEKEKFGLGGGDKGKKKGGNNNKNNKMDSQSFILDK